MQTRLQIFFFLSVGSLLSASASTHPAAMASRPNNGPDSCPASICGPSWPSQATSDYWIDARNGAKEGARKHGKQERVRILILHKNPFRFQYRVTIKTTPVAEPALTTFLGFLGGIVAEQVSDKEKGNEEKLKKEEEEKGAAAIPPPGCAKEKWALVTTIHGQLRTEGKKLDDEYTMLRSKHEEVQAAYKEGKDVLYGDQSSASELYAGAQRLRAVLQAYRPSLNEFQSLALTVQALTRSQKDVLKELEVSGCPPDRLKNFREWAGLYARLVEETYVPGLAKLREAKEGFDKLKVDMERVLKTPGAFYEEHDVGEYDLPTDVSLKLERKDLVEGGEWSEVTSADLNFGGGPRFALAGGVAFALLGKREYQRVQGFELDRQGQLVLANTKPNFTTVVGLKEDSDTRISPLMMLHGRVIPIPRISGGLHLSLGLTARNDNKGTDPEFFAGGSVSFLEERLFVTFGGYAGRKQELEGSLFRGAAVPMSLSEIPVRKDYRWSVGLALTYKIK